MQRGGGRRGRQGQDSLLLLMLGMEVYNQLKDLPIQPTTTFFLGLNALIHVNPSVLEDTTSMFGIVHRLSRMVSGGSVISDNCLSNNTVFGYYKRWGTLPWNRIFFSQVIHADDRHLYFNMLSFLYKGISLEQSLGSAAFLLLILYSWLASALALLLLNHIFGDHVSCAVGFSAVIFSLKYVLNQTSSDYTVVGGVQVPTKWAAWCELILIQLVNPNASFTGHLGGILVGFLYYRYLRHLLPKSLGGPTRVYQSSQYSFGSGYAR